MNPAVKQRRSGSPAVGFWILDRSDCFWVWPVPLDVFTQFSAAIVPDGMADQLLLTRDPNDLLASLFDLPRCLGVNAVTPALLQIEVIPLRETERAHQCEKVRFLARLEEFSRIRDVFVLTPNPHQHIPATDQGGAQSGGGNAFVLCRFD